MNLYDAIKICPLFMVLVFATGCGGRIDVPEDAPRVQAPVLEAIATYKVTAQGSARGLLEVAEVMCDEGDEGLSGSCTEKTAASLPLLTADGQTFDGWRCISGEHTTLSASIVCLRRF